MTARRTGLLCAAVLLRCAVAGWAPGEERHENFDKDPGWDGQNNRATVPEKRTIRQDFGYSRTANVAGKDGKPGGYLVWSTFVLQKARAYLEGGSAGLECEATE